MRLLYSLSKIYNKNVWQNVVSELDFFCNFVAMILKHVDILTKGLLSALCFFIAQGGLAVSPYINKVYEYRPAPGQFIGELPEYEPGDDYAAMLAKADEALSGDRMPGAVTLGAFGGYVVFGFDHTIVNVPGSYDFQIYGNAVISDLDNQGGSCEPGIVWVARDVNGNGLPDDEWFQLKGSEYANPAVVNDFSVTYYKPAAHTPIPSEQDKHITDINYIPFTASDGTSGFLTKNDYHSQSYWPEWLADTELAYSGVRLPDNKLDRNGDGTYFVLKQLAWGYADNQPNSQCPGFDLDNAVNAQGEAATLPGIDFVKVVCAMHQQAGSLGETSTEVLGAEDLHPEAATIAAIELTDEISAIYTLQGVAVKNITSPGIYVVLTAGGKSYKVIK